jgi:hypothetical protein
MAISLVQQLQADAIQRSAPITDLLRKAKLVAAKLKRSDLSDWIGHEIGGYEGVPNSKLPAYRQIEVAGLFRTVR